MKNSQLAAVIADTLASASVIDGDKIDVAIEKIQAKLDSHLGETEVGVTYRKELVTNERCPTDNGQTAIAKFQFVHKRIVEGTLTGTVYWKTLAVQSFSVDKDGKFTFTKVGQPSDVVVMTGTVSHVDGLLTLSWNTPPTYNHVVVNYEYMAKDE